MGLALASTAVLAMPTAVQAKVGDPVPVGDGATLDPIFDANLRYESVDQDDIGKDADALTLRIRSGAEYKVKGLSILAEAEATLGIVNDYNDTINGKTAHSVVADPENIELNRLQIGYAGKGASVLLGRQRIVLGNSRWVGNVGWRQNEQTFDALRGTLQVGPVKFDGTYAVSQRSIFGIDAGPRTAFDGDFWLGNADFAVAGVKVTAFSYLFDYDSDEPFGALSSQTYGAIASGKVPLGEAVKATFSISYARQSDWKNPVKDYAADYIATELGVSVMGFGLTGGYELLGSDNGQSVQTPMATLHKFNGWADTFLTTPAAGLQDYYVTLGKACKVAALPGLKAAVTWHKFDSDVGGFDYGQEWDAVLGFKAGPVGLTAKYANYDAKDGPYTDTEKLWLQASYSF